jgi:hypothetical protein
LLNSAVSSRIIERLENRILLAAQPYNWQNVNIGAGGFVDGIFYDPHNANTIYARTDIGGLYKTTNDGTTWNQLLDFVGNNTTGSQNGTQSQLIGVLSFAIDPENSNNIYADVGEYSGTNGAVFYSTNAGQTWSQTNSSFYVGGNSNGRGDGEQIAVDPNDSNIVLLGSNNAGLWESTNAGHSFTRIAAGVFSPTSTTFVVFDPTSGTAGNPSQTIYVGIDSTSTGTNLYKTTNGGSSWAQVTIGSGSGPASFLPGHAVLSGGNLYLGYANAETPNGTLSGGGVYRYTPSTGAWANIAPLAASGFGYDGVAADPNNPNTIVVTTFNDYSGPDRIWRTVNANAATPAWTELYDYSTAQNSGYNGYDTTRNTTNAPWTAANGDGIGNWAAAVAIDPNNSNQLMYGTGEGIWATNNLSNGGANTQLTAANSWYFPDTGIEFTAVGGVAATTAGTPLYSAMGDIGGFANTTLTYSPAAGDVGGSGYATDYAGTVPGAAAIVGSMGTTNGTYTTNGTTFSAFAKNPSSGTAYSGGSIAESANGTTIVWAPSGQLPYYTTNHGASWTAATGVPTGGTIVSDKVSPNYFYYWTENSGDNSWTLYISSNAGVSFSASAGGSLGTGNVTLAANQYVAGQLWISSYIGMYESTDFGASFSPMGISSAAANSNDMALGAPAPGASVPSIYIYGTITSGGFEGVYRSDDGGKTWAQINDLNHQWGGLIQTLAADPNVYGRVYIGINGRGIIMGNPVTSLATIWSDMDVNDPGNPGWATNSTTLSNGTIVNQWNVAGGGADLAASSVSISSLTVSNNVATATSTTANGFQVGQTVTISGSTNSVYNGAFVITGLANTTSGISSGIGSATAFTFALNTANGTAPGTILATLADQFNFAYQPIGGNATISAQLLGLTNADIAHGTPQAGVMFRAGTNPVDPFVEIAQTSAGSLVLEYRTASGGAVTTQTLGGLSVGSEYVELVRNGSTFTASYGSDGIHWTSLGGSPVSITAMPATANVGLMASAGYNPQLTDATFANVSVSTNQPPTVATPAAANPNPVTGTSTALSVLGADNAGESTLTYTWAATGPASVTYTGNSNGTNAGKNITANFSEAGTYSFTVTITDLSALTTTSTISNVVVQQTATTLAIAPGSITAATGGTAQFSATVNDQFGNAIATPVVSWGVSGTGNSVDGTGLVTLGSTAGSFTISAADGTASDTATVVADAAPTITLFQINDGNAQRSMIDSLTLVFSEPVTLASGAFSLNQRSTTGGSPTPMTFTQASPDGGTTWVLTFTDPSYVGHSLPDGTYDLTVTAADVGDAADFTMSGANPVYSFYRLYGDFEGTGSVNGSDFGILASAFGTNVGLPGGGDLWYLDYYGTGSVNGSDFGQFAARFGTSTTFSPGVLVVKKSSSIVAAPATSKVLSAKAAPPHHRHHGRK